MACGPSAVPAPPARHVTPAADPSSAVAPIPAAASTARCAADVPASACTAAGVRLCRPGDRDRVGEWRYALVAGPFEPIENVTAAQLGAAWRAGTIAATPETEAALAPVLGARGQRSRLAAGERPVLDAAHWAIVAAHDLTPDGSVVTVDDRHPLARPDSRRGPDGPLVVPLCGAAQPE